MPTVCIKHLASALEEADAFSLPEMTEGAQYIYQNLYQKLLHHADARLSEIDFDSFELDDVDYIRDLHSDVLEFNEYHANNLMHFFGKLPALAVSAIYV